MPVVVSLAPDTNIARAYLYSTGTATYTDLNLLNNQDYFSDTFQVGDTLYFIDVGTAAGWPSMALKFNVAIPIVATSYTLAWEYFHSINGWSALPSLVDDTVGFSVTGTNYVHWKINAYFDNTVINGFDRCWIRCRVASASGVTEGGKQAVANVQFKSAYIIIASGTVGSPASMLDVMAEPTVTNWGLVEDLTIDSNEYFKVYRIYGRLCQTANSYFTQKNAFLYFVAGYPSPPDRSTLASYWTFGEAYTTLPRAGRRGCVLNISPCANDGNIRWAEKKYTFYSSYIRTRPAGYYLLGYSADIDAYGTTFDGTGFFGGKTINLTDCIMDSWSTYLAAVGYVWTINGGNFGYLEAYQNSAGFMARDATATIVHLRWGTKFVGYDTTVTSVTWWPTSVVGGQPSNYYRHHSLTLKIQDINGNPIRDASIIIRDRFGNDIQYWSGAVDTGGLITATAPYTTDATGKTSKIDVLHYRQTRVYDPAIIDTITIYSPFTVIISKVGYITKTIKYTIDQKRDEVETLENRREV